ncbi:KxYKxGKxW signal peptide domain-containing protein, partial [Enterococcus faecalis]
MNKKIKKTKELDPKKRFKMYKAKKQWIVVPIMFFGMTVIPYYSVSADNSLQVLTDNLKEITTRETLSTEKNLLKNSEFGGSVQYNTKNIIPDWSIKYLTDNIDNKDDGGGWYSDTWHPDPNNPSSTYNWEEQFKPLPAEKAFVFRSIMRYGYETDTHNMIYQKVSGLTPGKTYNLVQDIDLWGNKAQNAEGYVRVGKKENDSSYGKDIIQYDGSISEGTLKKKSTLSFIAPDSGEVYITYGHATSKLIDRTFFKISNPTLSELDNEYPLQPVDP